MLNFLGSLSRRIVFGGGLSELGRILKGNAVPEGLRADRNAHGADGFRGLFRAGALRRDGIEDDERRPFRAALNEVEGRLDRLEVVDRGFAGDNDKVRYPGRLGGGLFDPGRRVDDRKVNASLLRLD